MTIKNIAIVKFALLLLLSTTVLLGQRMVVHRGLEFAIDEGTGEIRARAWTHTYPWDTNEWAIVESYVNLQISLGSTTLSQSSSWDNCGSGCADITLYSQVTTLGATYFGCSDHVGKITDIYYTTSEAYSDSDQRDVPLPPNVTLDSIDASQGTDLIFSYSISNPVLYSMQLSYGTSHLISNVNHASNVSFTINRSSFEGLSTYVIFLGGIYGQVFTYHSCPVIAANQIYTQGVNNIISVPKGTPPNAILVPVEVYHQAGISYQSIRYCQEPVGYASRYTVAHPTITSYLDTSVNTPPVPRDMDSLYTQERATLPTWGELTMAPDASQIQSPIHLSWAMAVDYSWFMWGDIITVRNFSMGFDTAAGLFMTHVGSFDFELQK